MVTNSPVLLHLVGSCSEENSTGVGAQRVQVAVSGSPAMERVMYKSLCGPGCHFIHGHRVTLLWQVVFRTPFLTWRVHYLSWVSGETPVS